MKYTLILWLMMHGVGNLKGLFGSHFGFGLSGVFVGDMHVGDSCDNFMKVNEI